MRFVLLIMLLGLVFTGLGLDVTKKSPDDIDIPTDNGRAIDDDHDAHGRDHDHDHDASRNDADAIADF